MKEILVVVAFCVVTVAYTVTALLSYFRGKKAKIDPAEANKAFANIVSGVNDLVGNAESAYSSVPKGGQLKSKDVLNDIKEQCAEAGIAYDKDFWIKLIKSGVSLINLNRKDVNSETTTNTTTNSTTNTTTTMSGPLIG